MERFVDRSIARNDTVKIKNITVAVDDEIYHRARIRAAELSTSVSALVAGFLKKTAEEETANERLMRLERETIKRIQKRQGTFSAENRMKRDELYDCHALR